MERIILYEELRLIERNESEINVVWKGAQILLFFLAFVFGSFCTFCFHMLMYLFDDKCVLFPKLLSLSSVRYSLISEFTPADIDEHLPVDFVSTQWVEKSACHLPTYVPLVSGIFGLVWTTMFLMCSTGSRTLTGLQRPWRVLLPVILFSLSMGGLCTYTSIVTHSGLKELCVKLGEITGSPTCTYTINVATLAYERRIRGVYQATQLTIATAWMHTACWLLSAFLALTRVLLAVDFQLVRVKAELIGNIDKMMEMNEKHVRTVSPDCWANDKSEYDASERHISRSSTKIHFKNNDFKVDEDSIPDSTNDSTNTERDVIYFAAPYDVLTSEMSLVPAEKNRLALRSAYKTVAKDKKFIVKIVYDLLESIEYPEIMSGESESTSSRTPETYTKSEDDSELIIPRQYGQEKINFEASKKLIKEKRELTEIELFEAEKIANEIKQKLQEKLNQGIISLHTSENTSKEKVSQTLSETPSKNDKPLKSSLKNVCQQTCRSTRKKKTKVQIFDSASTESDSTQSSDVQEVDKSTQTHPKEKQD
ncbi:uncharacterized protein LOC110385013 isoform X2 [Bombyx mori]|uniref:Uncharacterized protein n=1 Tax=Bombyx mori TaxID=7091 RepID=A0A8R2M7Z8_BOMMO|nr:uncharacterized protein LOC110385013 isoform X1 [Bombyx mori]